MKKITTWLLPFLFTLILVLLSSAPAFGKKPPWAGGPGGPEPIDPLPVYAPEPITITLIGMGASAAAGYYLGKKKNRSK